MPGPERYRAGRTGWRELHEANLLAHACVSCSALNPGLIYVERLGAIHVGDGDRHELELEIHMRLPFRCRRSARDSTL